MSLKPMTITLRPTGEFETFRGVQFRLYRGFTDRGVPLQMIGFFRIQDEAARAEFASEISLIPVSPPTELLTTKGLLNP
jgi:hypothetical protein